MNENDHLVMHRWDGQSKVASIWDPLRRDSDFHDDGNCLIYLSEPLLYREKYSFTVSLERLIAAKCTPLFEKLTLVEAYSQNKSKFRLQWKKHTYKLCLEASDMLNMEEVQLYHITTRNFFAWLMDKPIVGPDPASALLSLKLRMDLWRASTVDNFSDLHSYARNQGYGDLGDISLLLSNHLKGKMTSTDGYRTVNEVIGDGSVNGETNSIFKASLSKRVRNIQLRIPAFKHKTPVPNFDGDILTPTHTESPDDEALMSGAVPPDGDASTTFATLSKAAKMPAPQVAPSNTHGLATIKRRISMRFLNRRHRPSRTHSLPILPQGSIQDVSRELEKRSLWMECLAREYIERYQKAPEGSLPVRTSERDVSAHRRSPSPSSPTHSSRSSTYHQRTSLQTSRPPSPIQEEVADHAPPIPAKSPRRYSFDAINLGQEGESTIPTPSSWLQRLKSPEGSQAHTFIEESISASTTPALITMSCIHPSLPSQAVMSCNTCGKLKPLETVRRSLVARPSMSLDEQRYSFLLDSEVASGKPAHETLSEKMSSSELARSRSEAVELPLTRFPSLRKVRFSTASSGTEGKDIPPTVSMHSKTLYPFHHRNKSEPNLRSALASKNMQRRKRVTIEIPRFESNIIPSVDLPSSPKGHGRTVDSTLDMLDPVTLGSHKRRRDSSPSALRSPYLQGTSIDDERICGSALALISTMLSDIAISGQNTNTTTSPVCHALSSAVEESHPAKSHVSVAAHTDHEQELLIVQPTVKNRLRNSLRMWNLKRKSVDESLSQEYQGNILVMDNSGNFSTIPSPVNKSDFDWKEEEVIYGREKRMKLVHELP